MAKITKILFFVVISINLYSQIPYGQPSVHNFYTESKYIQSQVWDIKQSDDGRMLIATDQYLVSFDGFKFEEIYNSFSNSILSIGLQNDKIFMGTTTGLYQIKSGFQKTTNELKINSNVPNVRTILKQKKYTYFFSNKKNILFFYNNNFEFVSRPSNFEILRGFKAGGKIFAVSYNGIGEINKGKLHIISYKYRDIYKEDIRIFLQYTEDKFLIGTKKGNLYLYDYKTDSFERFKVDFQDENNLFYKGIKISDSLFALATLNNGVYIVSSDGNLIYHFTKDNGLLTNAVYTLFADSLGNLWLGTSQGISFINFSSFFFKFDENTGIDDMIYYTYIFKNYLIVSTIESMLVYDLSKKNNSIPYKRFDFKYFNSFTELKVENKKYLVAGGYGKYAIFNDKMEVVYEKKAGNINLVRNTGFDSSSFYHLDYQEEFKKEKVKIINGKVTVEEKNIFPSLQFAFRHIYVDKYNDLWLSIGNILFCVDYEKNTKGKYKYNIILYDFGKNNPNTNIKMFLEYDNKFFVLTDSEEYYIAQKPIKSKADTFKQIDLGLSVDLVNYLKLDKKLYLLYSSKILVKDFYENMLDSLNLPALCAINISNILSYKDYLFFNSNNAVFCVEKDFRQKRKNEINFQIIFPYFTENEQVFQISDNNDKKIIIKQKIDRKSELKFYFFVKPIIVQDYSYYYKLDKSDTWQSLKTNEIEFRHIEAGKHQLQIKVFDGHKFIYSPIIEFKVKPSILLTIWALLIYLIALGVLIFVVNRFITRRIRKRQLYLEKVIEKRAEQIAEQQSEILAQSELVENHKKRIEAETKKLKTTLFELTQMSLAAQNTEDAILILDKKGRFEWWNRSFGNLFAYKFEKYKNLPQREFQRKIRPDIYKHIKNFKEINMGAIHYNSHEIFENNEEIWYKTKITQIVADGKVAGYLVIDSNLTDYKILEEELFNQKEINLLLREKINILKAENVLQKENAKRLKHFDKINLEYSAYLKSNLTPKKILKSSFSSFFIFDKPQDEVSGDFVWGKKFGNTVYIALGDASGHKTRGAIMSSISYIMLDKIVGTDTLKPSEILESLNNNLYNFFKNNNISRDTLFLSVVKIELQNKKLLYAGARIPMIFVKMNKFSSTYKLESKHVTLGIKKDIKFDDQQINIEKNDRIYLYTDGWPNQLGALGIKKYSHNRIIYFFQNIQELNFEIHQTLISEEILHWKKNFEQIDDIMVLGIKI